LPEKQVAIGVAVLRTPLRHTALRCSLGQFVVAAALAPKAASMKKNCRQFWAAVLPVSVLDLEVVVARLAGLAQLAELQLDRRCVTAGSDLGQLIGFMSEIACQFANPLAILE